MCIVNVYLSRPVKRIRPNLTAQGQTAMLQDSDHLNAWRPAERAEVFKKKESRRREERHIEKQTESSPPHASVSHEGLPAIFL